jgi:hypothetical protein
MKNTELKPINFIIKRILVGTALLTYGIIFLVFALTLGYKKLTNAELIGCCVNGSVIIAIGLLLSGYNTYFVLKKTLKFPHKHLLIGMIWVPLFGIITNFIIINRYKHVYKNLQLAKDPN